MAVIVNLSTGVSGFSKRVEKVIKVKLCDTADGKPAVDLGTLTEGQLAAAGGAGRRQDERVHDPDSANP